MSREESFRLKVGLAEMLKGGVIMDVVNAEQAKIAEAAGAAAVMALERVPADIRRDGGVARMSPVSKIREIQEAVSIPVMAKCRIGHLAEARVLEALKVDFIDESEVLTPADEANHVFKHDFTVPVRLRLPQPGRGAAADRRGRRDDPHERGGGHRRHRARRPAPARGAPRDQDAHAADEGRAHGRGQGAAGSVRARRRSRREGQAPGAQLRRRRRGHAVRRRALHAARSRGHLRGLGDLQVRRPRAAGARDRAGDDPLAGRVTPCSRPRSRSGRA